MEFVSIILPIRNEEKSIDKTIQSIIDQDYKKELIEIIVADGMSTDLTKEKIIKWSASYNIKLIVNQEQTVSFGLNRAIAIAKGDIIVRMDAHSIYPSNYISTLCKQLAELKADNVGVTITTIPANNSPKCIAIASALSHPFGVGNSYFRINSKTVKEVDTVPFGCFRRDVFDKVGLFDTELTRNQDDEFNARMKKNGMKIYLIPLKGTSYVARDSISKLYKMYYQYGVFKPLVNQKIGKPTSIRQLFPPFWVVYLLLCWIPFLQNSIWGLIGLAPLFIYILINIFFSGSINKWKSYKTILWTSISFATLHLSYGLGYITGIIHQLLKQKPKILTINH